MVKQKALPGEKKRRSKKRKGHSRTVRVPTPPPCDFPLPAVVPPVYWTQKIEAFAPKVDEEKDPNNKFLCIVSAGLHEFQYHVQGSDTIAGLQAMVNVSLAPNGLAANGFRLPSNNEPIPPATRLLLALKASEDEVTLRVRAIVVAL